MSSMPFVEIRSAHISAAAGPDAQEGRTRIKAASKLLQDASKNCLPKRIVAKCNNNCQQLYCCQRNRAGPSESDSDSGSPQHRLTVAAMGCGASHSRVESSDGTDAGGFVHLRNLGEGVSLAGALAPKAQFKVAFRDGTAYMASTTSLTAPRRSSCSSTFAMNVDELREPTFCTTKALEDSSLRGKHSSVLELSRTTYVSTISTHSVP